MTINISQLIKYAIERTASDIHLAAGSPPMVRIDGDMIKVNDHPLQHHLLISALNEMLDNNQKNLLENAIQNNTELDIAVNFEKSARLRIHLFQQAHGMAIAIRILPQRILSLAELNLPPALANIANYSHGLVLVTGPTGSGKTTTLAALIDFINTNQALHIITIEDPIEYYHSNKQSLINQREISESCHDSNNALRSALRSDPDVIVLGELRDLATIRLALTAAETGHLVLATLHTTTTVSTIDRIIDVFGQGEKNLIRTICANVLRAVISQRLIKKKSGGRIALVEIMVNTLAIQNLIRENQLGQIYSHIQTGQQFGMQTFEQHLRQLIADHHLSPPLPAEFNNFTLE